MGALPQEVECDFIWAGTWQLTYLARNKRENTVASASGLPDEQATQPATQPAAAATASGLPDEQAIQPAAAADEGDGAQKDPAASGSIQPAAAPCAPAIAVGARRGGKRELASLGQAPCPGGMVPSPSRREGMRARAAAPVPGNKAGSKGASQGKGKGKPAGAGEEPGRPKSLQVEVSRHIHASFLQVQGSHACAI